MVEQSGGRLHTLLELIVGPPNSGKSLRAEDRCHALIRPSEVKLYVGLLPALPYYAARIGRHRARRGADWTLFEAGNELDRLVYQAAAPRECGVILIDGISDYVERAVRRQWLTSAAPAPAQVAGAALAVVHAFAAHARSVVIVATAAVSSDVMDQWSWCAHEANDIVIATLRDAARATDVR